MKPQEKIKLTFYFFGLAGIAFFIALLIREGVHDVFEVVKTAGWGVAVAAAFHIVPLMLDAAGWRVIFPEGPRPRYWSLVWMRWMGESINNLVPAAQVGGDVVRTRLTGIINGTPKPVAAASVIGNITVNVFAQIVFTLMGFALLIGATRQMSLAKPALAGAAISILAIGGFYAVQRLGGIRWIARKISKMVGEGWQSLAYNAEVLDLEIKAVYSRPRDVMICGAWALISWILGAGEIWIAMVALGMKANFIHALIFESMSQGFRTAMFFIPGALGVQEGGYLFVAGLLGIPGHIALALALIRRVRELALGVPGILGWQILEGNRLRHTVHTVGTAAK